MGLGCQGALCGNVGFKAPGPGKGSLLLTKLSGLGFRKNVQLPKGSVALLLGYSREYANMLYRDYHSIVPH